VSDYSYTYLADHFEGSAKIPSDLNFNNGSYGSPPITVLRAMRALSDECESMPDNFMKRIYLPHLIQARQGVAGIIGAGVEEVVIVPGATHGMNTILREIVWEDGDIIVACASVLALLPTIADKQIIRRTALSLRHSSISRTDILDYRSRSLRSSSLSVMPKLSDAPRSFWSASTAPQSRITVVCPNLRGSM
jgi:hypothetical protein